MSDWIKFLGTAGARFVVGRQLRSSAGMWCCLGGKDYLVDPGPGTLVKCFSSNPPLNPEQLDGVILTHRHIDHSSDTNIMVEAMTGGTFRKRGKVFLPEDALNREPVLFSYLQEAVEEVIFLKEGGKYFLGDNIVLLTPARHLHSVETYGLRISLPEISISIVADTAPFEEISRYYPSDVLILNVVLYQPLNRKGVQHLDFFSAGEIIKEVRPKVAVLTHFGMTMLQKKPWKLAGQLTEETGIKVIAAGDGFSLDLPSITASCGSVPENC